MKNRLGKKFGPPPKSGPNSQVPPIKLEKGGMGCGCDECMETNTRGTKGIQVKGFNFQGVR